MEIIAILKIYNDEEKKADSVQLIGNPEPGIGCSIINLFIEGEKYEVSAKDLKDAIDRIAGV